MRRPVNQKLINAFGKHLAELRKSKNMTQENLAEAADIDTSQIGKIEAGLINTSLNTCYMIARGMKVELKELMDFKVK